MNDIWYVPGLKWIDWLIVGAAVAWNRPLLCCTPERLSNTYPLVMGPGLADVVAGFSKPALKNVTTGSSSGISGLTKHRLSTPGIGSPSMALEQATPFSIMHSLYPSGALLICPIEPHGLD
ncbi:hypothetical protein [Paenibacillus sp. FSL R5-0519]|uniref:hypothetical protein n=1 Tax=Paenibacillus sp. FSL R5-0519 TaxID=2921648 RepID=UPI0030D8D938